MKEKIIKHYEKRIAYYEEHLELAQKILKQSKNDDKEVKEFWSNKVDKITSTINDLQEQLEYIKENLK